MKKHLPYINTILIIIITIAFTIFYFKLLHSFSHTVEFPNLVNSSEMFPFFKTLFNFGFIVLTTSIAIIFGAISAISFYGIKDKIRNDIEKQNVKISDQEKNIKGIKTHIDSLKGDLSFEVGKNIHNQIEHLLYKNNLSEKEKTNFIESSIAVCDYYSQSLIYKDDLNDKFKNSVKSMISDFLERCYSVLKDYEKGTFELETMGLSRYLRAENNIKKIADFNDKQNLSTISSKLNFPDIN